MIDLYCERTDAALWAEPLNALSNLAFVAAAYLAWRCAVRHGRTSAGIRLLIALLLAIALGSFLFHVFANTLTAVLDVTPIVAFQLAFLWLYSGTVIRVERSAQLLASGLLLALLVGAAWLATAVHGSLAYVPALLALLVLGIYHQRHAVSGRGLLLLAAALFAAALILRTVDIPLCDRIPIGTHLWWHLLNGVVLYLSLRALITARPGGRP